MRKTNFMGVISILSILILLVIAGMAYAQGAYENYDRPKGDYKVFDLERDDFSDCMNACLGDERCKAWVYFKPGCEGRRARCHLKNRVTPFVYNRCCLSGVKSPENPQVQMSCPKLTFATTSPLPSTVIGGDYSYQLEMSSGVPPYKFYPMQVPPDGTPPRVDTSRDQRFSMPLELKLSQGGLISGQVQPGQAGYIPLLIQVRDSCPSGTQLISKKFYMNIKKHP